MKLTPIENTLFNIFKKHKEEYEKIAGSKLDPNEITAMLLAEGFAKEPVIRYQEREEESALMWEHICIQTGMPPKWSKCRIP